MSKIKLLYFLLLLSLVQVIIAQDIQEVNRLKQEIAAAKPDSTKVKKLLRLSSLLNTTDYKNSIAYANEALVLSKELNLIKDQSRAYNCMADASWFHSDYDKAQQYYFKSYRINDSIKDKEAIAYSLYNIGWIICIQQHNYKEDHYLYESKHLYEELKDTAGLLQIYNALASYYADRNRVSEQKQYFDSAIVYFNNGVKIAKRANMYNDLGKIYGNMGDLFFVQKDYNSAEFYNKKSLEIHQKTNDSTSMNICMLNMGLCDLETNHIKEAVIKFEQAYNYNTRHDIKDAQLGVLSGLSKAYYKLGKYKEAYDYHEQYVALKEELDKEAYSTSISNLQGSYSLDKAEANVEQLKQANEIQELKNKKNSYFIFVLIGVALCVITVAVLLFRQNRIKQQSNIQLQVQNHIIAEKKLEIDNSIQYAKGIQLAVLPDLRELNAQFPESFVYYKPKDVVSGDFYWFGKVDNDFYCIAADCTGHGVPGAIMSIIGVDKIVQAVFEKKVRVPGEILSYLNKEIKQMLKQHSDASKQMDGMDIALLKFNTLSGKVEFAGANRSLIIVRNKALTEYKADKTAIAGFTSVDQEFKTTEIELQKNDSLYIFTDGYADQFGGAEGKKLMTKNLKDLFISIADKPAQEQFDRLQENFMNWKGVYEQVDDVLVIGIKIKR